MKKQVCIDFDGTLTRRDVQEYVRELLSRNIDVWVLTYRFDELHMKCWQGSAFNHNHNKDLFHVADYLGIPYHKIIFTNMQSKAEYLKGTGVIFHLDDDGDTVREINDVYYNESKIGYTAWGVYVGSSHLDDTKWKENCELLLG